MSDISSVSSRISSMSRMPRWSTLSTNSMLSTVSSTCTNLSTKQVEFLQEGLDKKTIYQVPGIGKVYGKRLHRKGFKTAAKIVGKFLALQRDEDAFKGWLKLACKSKGFHAKVTLSTMKTWTISNV